MEEPITPEITPGATPADAAVQTPSPVPGAQPEPQPTVIDSLDGLSLQQLEALSEQIAASPPQDAPTAPQEPVTPPAPPSVTETLQETPPAQPEEQPPEAKEPLVRIRLNQLPVEHREVIKQMRDLVATGKTPQEAALELFGQQTGPQDPAPASPDAPQAKPQPPIQQSREVEDLTSKLDTLKAEQTKALEEDFDTPKAVRLGTEIAKFEIKLEQAQQAAQAQAAKNADFVSAQATYIDQVKTQNPELLDESSLFYQEFADQRILAEAKNDPVLQSADWAVKIAERTHQRLGKPGAQPAQPAATAPRAAIPQPPQVQARPSGVLASGAPVPQVSAAEAMKAIENLSLEDGDKLLAQFG